MTVLIKNGRVVTAVDDYQADIFINGSTVALIGKDLVINTNKQIDASGKLVIPGGIDAHTHLEMPFGGTTSSETLETGTRAAAHGGTTCIVDFAVQRREDLGAAGARRLARQGRRAKPPRLRIPHDRDRLPQARRGEMRSLADNGVTCYKMFMAYPGAFLPDDGRSFAPCARPASTAPWFACTPKPASDRRAGEARAAAGPHRTEISRAHSARAVGSRGRHRARRSPRSPRPRSTSCI